MRKIARRRFPRLRRSRRAPATGAARGEQLLERLYPSAGAALRCVGYVRIPAHAPDWYFESELRRSGLWEMMERCYPSPRAQSQ
jgi:hypothetical protein